MKGVKWKHTLLPSTLDANCVETSASWVLSSHSSSVSPPLKYPSMWSAPRVGLMNEASVVEANKVVPPRRRHGGMLNVECRKKTWSQMFDINKHDL
jgi:hypothetical protein